jgi:hypothetical protein
MSGLKRTLAYYQTGLSCGDMLIGTRFLEGSRLREEGISGA